MPDYYGICKVCACVSSMATFITTHIFTASKNKDLVKDIQRKLRGSSVRSKSKLSQPKPLRHLKTLQKPTTESSSRGTSSCFVALKRNQLQGEFLFSMMFVFFASLPPVSVISISTGKLFLCTISKLRIWRTVVSFGYHSLSLLSVSCSSPPPSLSPSLPARSRSACWIYFFFNFFFFFNKYLKQQLSKL